MKAQKASDHENRWVVDYMSPYIICWL